MSKDASYVRDEVLKDTLDELSVLRQKILALPDQSQTSSALEAIDFYETELPTSTNIFNLLEWCGRAIADVTHEVAAAEFGWESPGANIVFEEQERGLNELLFTLRQASEANSKLNV